MTTKTKNTHQNVTLRLPRTLLKRAKIIAIERDMSLSRLLATYIEEIVTQEDAYKRAKDDALALLNQGFDLGSGGLATWTRDELHERG